MQHILTCLMLFIVRRGIKEHSHAHIIYYIKIKSKDLYDFQRL